METKGGFYITQIKQIQDRIFERLLVDAGITLTRSQGSILFLLWKYETMNVREISQQTSLAKNTVSIILKGMIKKDLIHTKTNPQNRRETLITLSAYAKSLKDTYATVSQHMNQIFYDGFCETERQQFENYLEKVLHTLTIYEKGRNATYGNKKSTDAIYGKTKDGNALFR